MAQKDSRIYSRVDKSSLSSPHRAVSTHIKLEWDIDFEKQTITGFAEHCVDILVDGVDCADFDSSATLEVQSVLVEGKEGSFELSDVHPVLGRKISVSFPPMDKGSSITIRFYYSVDETASALQWLAPSATKGGKHPYLFSQSQAIHARSMLPCMDSPGVKTPYTAVVTAPKWCTVLLSALQSTQKIIKNEKEDRNTFVWIQPVPIPAYLIALAAGNLKSKVRSVLLMSLSFHNQCQSYSECCV
jgi:leukotriene-A4 hydrolase